RRRREVRHRAKVPRARVLSARPALDHPDPVVSRRARARPAAVVLTLRKFRLADTATRWLENRCQSGTPAMSATLLADIGGSKSRFALANSAGGPERTPAVANEPAARPRAA